MGVRQESVLTDTVCSLQRELRAWGQVLQQTGVLRTKLDNSQVKEELDVHYSLPKQREDSCLCQFVTSHTGWELCRSKSGQQDSSAFYQGQQDAAHGCRAHHGYWSI